MNLTTVRNRTKIYMLMVAAAGMILAGCDSHPTTSTAQHGQALSGVALASHANCGPELTVGWADNGTTRCVQMYGQVTVELRLPDGTWYRGRTGVSGSSLLSAPTPGRSSAITYRAVSSGTAVISTIGDSCLPGHACPPLPPWSVNVVVL